MRTGRGFPCVDSLRHFPYYLVNEKDTGESTERAYSVRHNGDIQSD
jgi:hypothetical protein